MNFAVELTNVSRKFRSVTAIDSVSFGVETHSITGLLGRNGAGKTTLMNLIAGHDAPTSGHIKVFGENPLENAHVLQKMNVTKESQKYPDSFCAQDVFDVGRFCFPEWDTTFAQKLSRDFEIPLKRLIKKLSRGQRSALGIVTGLASRAQLTIFDEPYLGLDAVSRQHFYDELLADYAQTPRTIILSSHLIDEIASLLENVIIIDRAAIIVTGTATELCDSSQKVSGELATVTPFIENKTILSKKTLGHFTEVIVTPALTRTEADVALTLGLSVEKLSLQEAVIARSPIEDHSSDAVTMKRTEPKA